MSRALFDFLDYLRLCKVVTTSAPQPPESVNSLRVKRYADFLRNEKGLAELSLKVYTPENAHRGNVKLLSSTYSFMPPPI